MDRNQKTFLEMALMSLGEKIFFLNLSELAHLPTKPHEIKIYQDLKFLLMRDQKTAQF